jgi:hypothetical protein
MDELPEPVEQPAIKARAAAQSALTAARCALAAACRRPPLPLPLLRGKYADREVMKSRVMTGD